MNSTLNLKGRKVVLHDMCLRDGMHAKREQISVEQMVKVGTALDEAGMPYIQVTHGAGLGGNSLQHGFALASNEEYINAVASRMKQAKISILLVPGLGTMRELQSAYDAGGARHCGGDREGQVGRPDHLQFSDLLVQHAGDHERLDRPGLHLRLLLWRQAYLRPGRTGGQVGDAGFLAWRAAAHVRAGGDPR